jgi:hypothetical protein
MDYVVLFDVATKPRAWTDPMWVMLAIMLAVVLIVAHFERSEQDEDPWIMTRLGWIRTGVAIGVMWLASGVWSYESDRTRWIALLARGQVSTVEGKVSNFTAARSSKGSHTICFTVEPERFCYNLGATSPEMTSCSTIRKDLWVRVSYHDYHHQDRNPILRLEARQDSLDLVNAFPE